jgi:tRNA-specific 2-thiouridylase
MRRPGPVRDIEGGGVLGEHAGLLGYTIGQRHGVGIASRERLYVVKIDPGSSTLWLGKREAVRCEALVAAEGSLLAPPSLLEGDGITAKVRYRRPAVPCTVRIRDEGTWDVRFPEGEGAVSPGQSIVFYRGDRVIAGARIESARSPDICPTPV